MRTYSAIDETVSRRSRSTRTTFRMDCSYARGPWRGGMNIMMDQSERRLRDAKLSSEEGVTEMYFGRSLDGWLRR